MSIKLLCNNVNPLHDHLHFRKPHTPQLVSSVLKAPYSLEKKDTWRESLLQKRRGRFDDWRELG